VEAKGIEALPDAAIAAGPFTKRKVPVIEGGLSLPGLAEGDEKVEAPAMVMDGGRRQRRTELAGQAQRSIKVIDCAGIDDLPANLSCVFALFHVNELNEDLKVKLELSAMAGSFVLVFNNNGNLLCGIVGQPVEEV
jgi:hypothetical protein